MGEILTYHEMRDAMRCFPLSNIVNLDDYFLSQVKEPVCPVCPSCQRQTNTISKTKIVLDLNSTRKKMFAEEIKRRDESNAKQSR